MTVDERIVMLIKTRRLLESQLKEARLEGDKLTQRCIKLQSELKTALSERDEARQALEERSAA